MAGFQSIPMLLGRPDNLTSFDDVEGKESLTSLASAEQTAPAVRQSAGRLMRKASPSVTLARALRRLCQRVLGLRCADQVLGYAYPNALILNPVRLAGAWRPPLLNMV